MYQLTIYTPTYNRAHLLPRLYESLCKQTNKEFYWLIVDDGSIDNTEDLIQEWIKQRKVNIKYKYKENGGVHTARDYAFKTIETELLVAVDSDDWIPYYAVEYILEFWKKNGGESYAGIFAPNMYLNGKSYNEKHLNVKEASYQQFTYELKYKGDKITIIRSKVIKEIPISPVYPGENIVPEGYKWIQLSEDMPFLITNKPLKYVEYQEDGYTYNAKTNFFKNPNGKRANHFQHIMHAKYFKPKLKGHIGYILYSIHLKDKSFIKDSPVPLQTILFLPIGLAGYLYACIRERLIRQ